MKWEARELENGTWGIFLMKKYCKTDEPVCYGVSLNELCATRSVERLNNPLLSREEDSEETG